MATDLERLVVSLSADIKSYEKALAKAQGVTSSALRRIEGDATKSMGRFEKTMGRAGNALAGFGKGLVLGGIATAIAGLGSIVNSSVETAAAIGDLSDKLGITTDKLQELQYGAVQANMEFGDLEKNLLKFSKSLGEARNGQGELLETLRSNGFTDAKIKALSFSQALDVMAELIRNAATEADAMLIATQAFGRAGDDMVEFLRDGSAGLAKFATDAKNAGSIISSELIKSAQAFDDAWAAALLSVKSKLGDLVLSAVPLIQRFDQAVSDAADRLGVAIGTIDPATLKNQSSRSPFVAPATQSGSGKGDKSTKVFNPEVDAAAKQAAKELTREKEKQAEAIQRVIDALNLEASSIGKSNVQQQVATALSRADVSATSEQGKAIQALIEKTEMHRAVLETVAFAAEQAAERQQEFIESQMYLAQAGVSAFQQLAIEGGKLSDVITDLAKSLAEAALQATLFGSGPLAGLFGSTGGGLFSSLFSPVGLYAKGGQIPSGQMGIAGEAGPELIQGPANVIPFSKISGGGRQTVNINVNLSGANGNAEVERIAQRGVQKGLREYQRQQPQVELERGLRQT